MGLDERPGDQLLDLGLGHRVDRRGWKHSHNYIHHTYTNIRGKDRDLGYEIMRIHPHQKSHPVYLAQPVYNVSAAAFLFAVGRGRARPSISRAIRSGEKPKSRCSRSLGPRRQGARAAVSSSYYVSWPLVSAVVA